jgi:hypothetical protein
MTKGSGNVTFRFRQTILGNLAELFQASERMPFGSAIIGAAIIGAAPVLMIREVT